MVKINLNNYKGSSIYYKKDGYRYLSMPDSPEINAGKYYYLAILSFFHDDKPLADKSIDLITWIYEKTTRAYDSSVWEHIVSSCTGILHDEEVFFFIIYLAMLDLEVGSNYPFGSGKRMVYESCKAVLIDGKNYEEAAVMFSKHRPICNAYTSPDEDDANEDYFNEWDKYGRSGEKYGWYNGYSDDVIDDAFDGCPEATWNVD